MPGFLAAAAPYAIPAGMSIAQGILGNRQAKRDQQRMEEQAKQDKLIQAFNPQAQPTTPQQASQPGIGQTLASDPMTRKLLEQIAESKFGIKPLGSV
jgi:hypothetical protein